MGFWSTLTDWWSELVASCEGQPASGTHATKNAAAIRASDDVSGSATVAVAESDAPSDDVMAERPWWRPEGALVLQAPKLAKPSEDATGDANEAAILSALESTLNDTNLELPHLPHVPHQVLLLTRRSNVGMREIAGLVSQDQVLSATLLRRANSAAYGGATKVTVLDAACVRLGLRGIRSFMISQSVKNVTLTVGSGRSKSRGESLWRQSLASAYIMASYADCFKINTDEPFLIGLLHDIGKVVVLRACYDAERASGTPVSDRLFDYVCQEYHELMGEMIADHWQLPERVGAIVRNHHGEMNSDEERATDYALIQLTDATVSLLGYAPFVPYDLLGLAGADYLQATDNPAFRETLELLPEVIDLAMHDS